jgi:geranylgeranyl diphosphate synthase, type II
MTEPSSQLFLEYAEAVRPEIEAALERYTQYDADCPPVLREAIRHSLLASGKRLRPLLVLMSAQACGCPRGEAMPAACAVEMVHTYSLIHDDLPAMDDDQVRRGRPCCHVKFGEANAILAGDALLAQAFEVIAGEVQPAGVAAACCLELARAAGASALVGGQVDDLQGAGGTGELAQLERIHRRKTGAMFQVSLRLGGRIAKADSPQIAALNEFGKKLGLAFQIVDDLLDVKGEAASLGKSVGKDRQQAKLTFPALLGLAESQRRAEALVQDAQRDLNILGAHAGCLQSLAHYVLERNR